MSLFQTKPKRMTMEKPLPQEEEEEFPEEDDEDSFDEEVGGEENEEEIPTPTPTPMKSVNRKSFIQQKKYPQQRVEQNQKEVPKSNENLTREEVKDIVLGHIERAYQLAKYL